jgi:putative ABC transport system substrate-binding protein
MFTCLFWIIAVTSSPFAGENAVIAVIESQNIEPYNAALEGFKRGLKGQGFSCTGFIEYGLKGEKANSLHIIEEIRDKKPDLILTLGSISTAAVLENIKDIPVVFSMILNPVASGFVKSLESSGNNATGVSMDIPIKTQFANLKMLIPEMKRIGTLYNPRKTRAIVSEASGIARKMGLELVAESVDSDRDVPEALEELAKQVDALWAVVDNTVYNPQSARYILLFTLRNKIPFMAFSVNFVEAGALMALYCDYNDIGRQSAEIAIKILRDQKPNNIPISPPRDINIAINRRVAEVIGIEIPPSILYRTDKIFE